MQLVALLGSGALVPSVLQAGVDTWSPAWYVGEDSPAARAMRALATEPSARSKLVPDRVAGHRLGWFPTAGLVFFEGHPGGDRLALPRELPEALALLHDQAGDLGVPLPLQDHRDDRPGFAGLRRLDSTVDLSFDTEWEGLAALAGVAALGMPRTKQAVWRGQPRVGTDPAGPVGQAYIEALDLKRHDREATLRRPIETVAFYGYSGRKMVGRWYDKGIESGAALRGRLIRPENQDRFVKDTRRGIEEVASGDYVRDRFQRRFLPLYKASKGVTVGGSHALAAKLRELVEDGDLSPRMAESLAGYVLLEEAGQWCGKRRTGYNRRAALRDHGLVLSDLGFDDVEVDLHEVLELALDAGAWGHG